jgi:hypothetical protein
MSTRRLLIPLSAGIALLAVAVVGVQVAVAHCDGLDGPVVSAARNALRTGNVNLALIWVQPTDEQAIRAAFAQATTVRAQSREAQALADRYFFETLVRMHRAGEGAPYTGLKPAGRDLGPAIPAADRALETGTVAPLRTLLTDAVQRGLQERFQELRALRRYDPTDLAAGRRYVAAYVQFIHYAERLHEAAVTAPAGHLIEATH